MYLSEAEEIVAYIVCIAIIIGFVATTYMEIKNTIAEEKQKQKEKNENETKIKILIEYFNSKKKLIDSLVKAKKSIDKKFKTGYLKSKKWSEMTANQRGAIATDANFAKKLDNRVLEVQLGDKKVKLPKGMRVTSIANAITPIEEFYKKLLKWKKNPTADNWKKTVGLNSTANNFRKYLLGGKPGTTKSLTPQTFNLFENLNLKSAVNANEIKTINSLSKGDTSLKSQAQKKNLAKATKLKQEEILNQ